MTRPLSRLAAFTLFDRLFCLRDWLRRPNHPPAKIRLHAEALEDRVVPDGRPLPYPVIYVGADAGGAPLLRSFGVDFGLPNYSERLVADPAFTGGVRVASADITVDGVPDIIVALGPGTGPQIQVLDGTTGDQVAGPLGSFLAFDSTFTGGVYVAAADVDGDGIPDIIAGAGQGGGPHVKVFSGTDGSLLHSFFAFESGFTGGVSAGLTHYEPMTG